MYHTWHNIAVVAGCLGLVLSFAGRSSADELERRASWSLTTAADVKQQVDAWLEAQQSDEVTRAKVEALWLAGAEDQADDGLELLERLTTTIALVSQPAKEVVMFCRGDRVDKLPLSLPVLNDEQAAPLVRNNLRLLLAVWLAQRDLYDEALEQIDGLQPADVVDPASLLFYQAVGHHRLLHKDKCLPAVSRLLENDELIPRRYLTLARLIEADLKPLKTDSLGEVAHIMDTIGRRLRTGQAGKRVRKEEDDVIAKLDKLIEELEQQSGGGGGGAGGGTIQSSSPAPDSAALGGRGPGNVDPKNIGNTPDWGNLPPKERQEALQRISKDLPAHYREVIESYFKKLAEDGVK